MKLIGIVILSFCIGSFLRGFVGAWIRERRILRAMKRLSDREWNSREW
jgi:hypothetical protein